MKTEIQTSNEADSSSRFGKDLQTARSEIRECNACDWKGPLSDTCMLGAVGPLCPECRETTESAQTATPVAAPAKLVAAPPAQEPDALQGWDDWPESNMVAACCGRKECGGECGNEWRGMEVRGGAPAEPRDDSDRRIGSFIGYVAAAELHRLNSGHDANLRSAKFGPSVLDGDIPVYIENPEYIAALEATVASLTREAHDWWTMAASKGAAVAAAQSAAYAEGRKDEREDLQKRGILADCPACNGVGERPVFDSSMGPDAGDGGIQNCPDCDGTGFAKASAD